MRLILKLEQYKYLFFSIVLIKVLMLALFSSEVSSMLFQPFVHTFISGEWNPWQYYYDNGLSLDAFPYHGFMLVVHVIPAALIEIIPANDYVYNVLFKLPVFISDIFLYVILLRMFPAKKMHVTLLYFLNPIVIYSTYIQAQLDIIPSALIVYSIYFLLRERLFFSSVLLGLALATKSHVLVVMPLLILFVFKKYSFKQTLQYALIPTLFLFLLDAPFLVSKGFMEMVVFNSKQSLIFDSHYKIGSLQILLPILAVLVVYFHFGLQKRVNMDLMNFYITALFTLVIALIYPAPGWYVWLAPFVTIYFLQIAGNQKVYLLSVFFGVIYLCFFVFCYEGDYSGFYWIGSPVKINFSNSHLVNITYTILEATLLIILYLLYKHGINSNSIYTRRTNLTLGIGGDSGVGKTTFVDNVSLLLGDRLLKLEGDGEHKWERGNENWSQYTHLDPKANNIHKQAQAIISLKNDKAIYRSEYDHSNGTFTDPVKVVPKDFIAISGLHPFYLPKLRKTIDLKIYMDTDEKLRRHWKIIRDTKHRGYSLEKIMSQIEARTRDAEKYIHPQKNFSDLTIKLFPQNEFELGSEHADIQLCLKVTLDANFHLEEIIDNLNCPILWDYNEDLVTQYLIFEEEPRVDFRELANKTILNVSEILNEKSEFLEGYDGFVQYLTLLLVSEKLKDDV